MNCVPSREYGNTFIYEHLDSLRQEVDSFLWLIHYCLSEPLIAVSWDSTANARGRLTSHGFRLIWDRRAAVAAST